MILINSLPYHLGIGIPLYDKVFVFVGKVHISTYSISLEGYPGNSLKATTLSKLYLAWRLL